MRAKEKPIYKIIGAYDSETTNYTVGGVHKAFPILHQLGIIETPIEDITPETVESCCNMHLFRHTLDLFAFLDEMIEKDNGFVPVICCHNLAFDMYGLSSWLMRHDVEVLAKSARKPITFRIKRENGSFGLVLWDTLIFSQQPLRRMGEDCGYCKAVGEWDYDLIRTPETPLTDDEIEYATKDVYALLAWLGWWIRRNPDIDHSKLGVSVVTKTGVVRERRKVRFSKFKGKGLKYNCGHYWTMQNIHEQPKTDDELFTMQAATRGGFTFCASANASVPFELENTGYKVFAFDAVSMHPAQMVSHKYPEKFHDATGRSLTMAFDLVRMVTLDRVLAKWENPFNVAFYGAFEFTNLRPKANSLFEKFGILPLASARYKQVEFTYNEDNGDYNAQNANRADTGYCDQVQGANCAFGKIVSAQKAVLYITELTAWEICQCYDFDSVRGLHGYITGKFVKPTDMSIVSVMQFYKAKNVYKRARSEYYEKGSISNPDDLLSVGIAESIVSDMQDGILTDSDVESTYLSLKADLNSLFGIEASNEYRRDNVLTEWGIDYVGEFGLQNAPKVPKTWYQFGQRIVGWSRIAQICAMQLAYPFAETIVNGDTDSIKIVAHESLLGDMTASLEKLGCAIDRAKEKICRRIKRAYPDMHDDLANIGHYELEFSAEYFCASWNKAYCTFDIDKRDGKRHFSFTLAGIPTSRRNDGVSTFIGVNGYADRLHVLGYSYSDVCNLLLGYNVCYAYDLIRMNGRTFPEWGGMFYEHVTDYRGVKTLVCEPCALALHPMAKVVNDTGNWENAVNCEIAQANNPEVNTEDKILTSKGVFDLSELI